MLVLLDPSRYSWIEEVALRSPEFPPEVLVLTRQRGALRAKHAITTMIAVSAREDADAEDPHLKRMRGGEHHTRSRDFAESVVGPSVRAVSTRVPPTRFARGPLPRVGVERRCEIYGYFR
jgi:hypothetical protein